MAVYILSDHEQKSICDLFLTKRHTLYQLATYFNVSPTTVRQVLLDHKVIKPKAILSVDEAKKLKLLTDNNLSLEDLAFMIESRSKASHVMHPAKPIQEENPT